MKYKIEKRFKLLKDITCKKEILKDICVKKPV